MDSLLARLRSIRTSESANSISSRQYINKIESLLIAVWFLKSATISSSANEEAGHSGSGSKICTLSDIRLASCAIIFLTDRLRLFQLMADFQE